MNFIVMNNQVTKFKVLPVPVLRNIFFCILVLAGAGTPDPLSAKSRPGKNLREHNLFPSISFGAATIINDDQLEANYYTGSILGISAGYNMSMEKFSLDLKLGWSTTAIEVEAGEELRNSQPDIPAEINTSFGEAEASARLRLASPFEAGLTFLMPFGVDTTFAPYEDPDDSPNIFFGLDFLFAQSGARRSVMDNLRYGVQIYLDANIADRDVFIARANIGYSFPVAATPRYKTKYKEKIKTKKIVRYKTKVKNKIVTKVKNNYLIDAGIIYFETGKSDLTVLTKKYITSLAKYLKKKDKQWEQIMITSHTDKRGSDELNNKLSESRNKAISSIFIENGISLARLKLRSLAKKRPVEKGTSSLELARNRRVEITIAGPDGMRKLKATILLMMQRFKLPATCDDGDCK